MTRTGFHTLRDASSVTLTRRLPPRFDVVAETRFPLLRKTRLAHQIRQDLWRALQSQRGFSPVVEVREEAEGLVVRAGGQVDAKYPRQLSIQVAALLADPALRARWARVSQAEPSTRTGIAAKSLRCPNPVD